MSTNNVIITLKSIKKDGFYKLKIKPIEGEIYYQEISPDKIVDFLTACEFYAETKNSGFLFVIPDYIKKMCSQWLQSLAISNNAHNNK